MNPLEVLKQEHLDIERELFELESILTNGEEINYSNLVHVLKNLVEVWDNHEKKEEKIFPILTKDKIIIQVKRMLFEHRSLSAHKEAIFSAINSGDNEKIKKVLDLHGRIIIEKLRKHINFEDEILYPLALSEFSEEELEELLKVKL